MNDLLLATTGAIERHERRHKSHRAAWIVLAALAILVALMLLRAGPGAQRVTTPVRVTVMWLPTAEPLVMTDWR